MVLASFPLALWFGSLFLSRVNGVGAFPISKDILIFVFDFSSCPMIGEMNTFWLISGATASSFWRGSLGAELGNMQTGICRAVE